MSVSFKPPKEPGRLSDDARSYTIPHRSKYFLPWTIVAEPPTWRDVWAILRRRYRPKLVVVALRLTSAGLSRMVKDVWTGPQLERQLYEAGPLATMPIIKRKETEE